MDITQHQYTYTYVHTRHTYIHTYVYTVYILLYIRTYNYIIYSILVYEFICSSTCIHMCAYTVCIFT